MDAVVQWIAPPRVWTESQSADARRPAILRFATDSFMNDFTTVLNNQPERLIEWRAKPETWRGPSEEPTAVAVLPPAARRFKMLTMGSARSATPVRALATTVPALSTTPLEPPKPLKLYQPAHQRFYLMSACLVCRLPGLPDRMLEVGAGERVSFVVRRLRPKTSAPRSKSFVFDLTTCDEYALVNDRWEKVTTDLMIDEEQLTMFPYSYLERDGRKRRLLSAMLPVSNREKYAGAMADPLPLTGTPTAEETLVRNRLSTPIDPRKALLMRDVTDVWRSLVKRYEGVKPVIDDTKAAPASDDATKQLKKEAVSSLEARQKDDADYLSWLILIDLRAFLKTHVEKVWLGITAGSAAGLNTAETAVYNRLVGARIEGLSLAQALIDIAPFSDSIEKTTYEYSAIPDKKFIPPVGTWPSFKFPLQDLRAVVEEPKANALPTLDDQINAALPTQPTSIMPALPLAVRLTQSDVREPLWFVVRCVFERPNCGPLSPIVMSDASEPFQMASFFDSDAPARPIRIPMPMDITPAGLRKFDKNTAFMLSDALCAQVTRARELSFMDLVLSVLPWPFYKALPKAQEGVCNDGLDIGMICSLSIPIITICALILLIIFVLLLDLIFHWIPFFITCFPIPNFKAKEA